MCLVSPISRLCFTICREENFIICQASLKCERIWGSNCFITVPVVYNYKTNYTKCGGMKQPKVIYYHCHGSGGLLGSGHHSHCLSWGCSQINSWGVESSQRLPQAPLRLMMGWWWKSQTAGDWNSWGSMDLPPPSLWYFNMVFRYSGIVQLDFLHGDKSLPRVSVPRETSRHRVVLFSLILKVSIISIVLFISTFDSLKCS